LVIFKNVFYGNKKENKTRDQGKKENNLAPDPATLHTTDPQRKWKGRYLLLFKTLRRSRRG
jgi:hypothetical protein